MGVKVKLSDVVAAGESIQRFMGLKLPFKLAYRVQKIARKVLAEIEDFDNTRIEVVKKYINEGESFVPPEKQEEFRKELNEVLEEEIDLNIELIPFSLVENLDVDVEPVDLMRLAFLFEEPTS